MVCAVGVARNLSISLMRKSRSVWVSGCASTAASDGSALAMGFWRSATSMVLSATKVLTEWRTAGSLATGATVATHLAVLKTRLSDQRARALITRPTTAMMTRMSASQRRSRGAPALRLLAAPWLRGASLGHRDSLFRARKWPYPLLLRIPALPAQRAELRAGGRKSRRPARQSEI